ncbi:MAG TPA: hypothetical protein VF487_10245 [Chitinophagaceae bacterium]
MFKIYIPLFIIFLTSCTAKIRYIGKSFSPTKSIEVYVTEQSIKRPFEYIGRGYVGGIGGQNNPNKIQQKAEKLGREKGADAVLITDYYILNTEGVHITSTYRTDSIAPRAVTTGNTFVSPTSGSGYNILFLKYNK